MKKKIFIILLLFYYNIISSQDLSWLKKNQTRWKDDKFEYFVGISNETTNEKEAIEQATNDVRKILSSEIITQFSSSQVNIKDLNVKMINQISGNKKKNIKIEEFSESVKTNLEMKTHSLMSGIKVETALFKKKGIGNNTTYQYKALIKLPISEYNDLIEGPKKEDKLKIQQIKNNIEDANKLINNGNIIAAIENLNNCVNIFNSLIFWTQERVEVINDINKLITNIITNLNTEIVSGNNQTIDIGKNSLQPIIIRFKYKDMILRGLKIVLKSGEEQAKIEYDKYTDNNGEIKVNIKNNAKIGKCGALFGLDTNIGELEDFGAYITWNSNPPQESTWGVIINHIIQYNNENIITENILDILIRQEFSKSRNFSIFSSKNEKISFDLFKAIEQGNIDSIIDIGGYAGARYIIIGNAICILNKKDDIFEGYPKVILKVFDIYEKKLMDEKKFEITDTITGTNKDEIAKESFKKLRSNITKWLERGVLK